MADWVLPVLIFWWLQDPPPDPPTEQLEAKDQGVDVSHEAAKDNWWYIGRGTHMDKKTYIYIYMYIYAYIYVYIYNVYMFSYFCLPEII